MSVEEFKLTLDKMINEIELAFEYIPKDIMEKLKNLTVTDIVLNSFYEEHKEYNSHLINLFVSDKIHKKELDQFNKVVLFDIMPFELFKEENRSTKRSLLKYISRLYVCSNSDLIEQCKTGSCVKSIDNEDIDNFTSNIQDILPTNMSGIIDGGLGDLLKSDAISNIVSNLNTKMQEKNMDPMSLLMSMMTGQKNAQQEELLNDLSSSINSEFLNNKEFSQNINRVGEHIQNNPELRNLDPSQLNIKNLNLNNIFKK